MIPNLAALKYEGVQNNLFLPFFIFGRQWWVKFKCRLTLLTTISEPRGRRSAVFTFRKLINIAEGRDVL